MAAECLAICCYAMVLSYYSNALSWHCNVRTVKVYCHVIVLKLLLCCYILIVFYGHTIAGFYFRIAVLVASYSCC